MKRTIALILILVMMFSLVACSSAEDEEEAAAGEIVENNESDNTNDNNSNDNSNNSNNSNDSSNNNTNDTSDEPSDDTNDNNNQDEEENTPPVSTEGKYKVTFDYGHGEKNPFETRTDGELSEPEAVRRGYEFEGWYNGSQKWDFSKKVTSDMTLTATWKIIKYTITYNADGATLPDGLPTSYTVEDNIQLKPASKTGKSFLGYSINNGTESIISNEIVVGTTGNLTLKPAWDENAFVFGVYEQDGDETNGEEPIEWVKIKEDGSKAMFVTKNIIDVKQWDNKNGGSSIKWMNSNVRTWLNGTFYKKAFSNEEKEAIVLTKHTTPGKWDGVTTEDNVFILSSEEAKTLLTSYASRKAKVTPYAEANGAQNDSSNYGWWWLRDKVGDYATALVEQDGNIRMLGYNSGLTTIGIRAVIWVDMSKLK